MVIAIATQHGIPAILGDQDVISTTAFKRIAVENLEILMPIVMIVMQEVCNVPEDVLKMIKETGCDGVMIGRGALGNPWVFQESGRPEDVREIMIGAKAHLDLIEAFLPTERILGYIKNHMCRYFKGLPGSSALRQNIFAAPDLADLKQQMEPYCQLPSVLNR